MTTISFDQVDRHFINDRSRHVSFAVRLAALRAQADAAPRLSAALHVVIPAALALVPVTALGWMFATL